MQAAGGAALNDASEVTGPEVTQRPGPRRRAVGILVALAALVLLIDLVTKQLAVALLAGEEPVRLLGGAVYLVYATNSGAAFGIGADYTFVFPLVAFAVITWIGWLAWRTRSVPWGVALGLVVGGAAGNLVDRLFRPPGPMRGEVVDMVSILDPYGRVWPVFNVADSALVVGFALAVLLVLTGRLRDGTRAAPSGREA